MCPGSGILAVNSGLEVEVEHNNFFSPDKKRGKDRFTGVQSFLCNFDIANRNYRIAYQHNNSNF